MRRVLVATAAVFAAHAAPSAASCADTVEWRGQLYFAQEEARARPGAPLSDRARLPGDCGPITSFVGGPNPRPLKPEVMEWGVVRSIVGVPPTVAVMREGRVYRNTAPLKAPPFFLTG